MAGINEESSTTNKTRDTTSAAHTVNRWLTLEASANEGQRAQDEPFTYKTNVSRDRRFKIRAVQ